MTNSDRPAPHPVCKFGYDGCTHAACNGGVFSFDLWPMARARVGDRHRDIYDEMEKMIDWCLEHGALRNRSVGWVVYFRTLADATLFKLRWG
jgi:hypothetical protein